MRLTIRKKLVLAICIPLVAAYGAMLLGERVLNQRVALADARTLLTEIAARRAAELNLELAEAEELVRALAVQLSSTPELSLDRVRATLQDQLRAHPDIYGMCAAFEPGVFPEGRPAVHGNEGPAASAEAPPKRHAPYYCRDSRGGLRFVEIAEAIPHFFDLPWYRPAKLHGRPFWTEPYFDAGVGERIMCTFTAPIVREGKFRGVLTADLLDDRFLKSLENVRIANGYCMLVSASGQFISHPDRSLVLRESIFSLAERLSNSELAAAGRAMIAGRAEARRIDGGRDAEWLVFAPVESAGWSLAAVIPEAEILEPIHAQLRRLAMLPAAALATILAIVFVVSGYMTRPLQRLTEAADALGRGDLDARVPEPAGDDEVARLSRRFNAMVGDLKTNVEARLRDEAARRRIEGEMNAAREIQASLLPPSPAHDPSQSFDLFALNVPAKTVAGDFYDFFRLEEHRLALAMADVSGKGMPAAVYMAVARTTIRACASPERTPAEILSAVNRRLCEENDGGMFLSVFFGFYEPASGTLTYASAGHNPPYLVRAGGIEPLEPTGPLAAVFSEAMYQNGRRRLEPGDMLFLFTDGITEAGAGRGELFGEERLEQLLRTFAERPVEEVCRGAVDAARAFAGGELDDDATVLALRRTR